jgi:hypothetical protein
MDSMTDAVTIPGRRLAHLDAEPAGGVGDYSLHADTEAICPRCLRWIAPEDYLRRNAIGLLQHESCPPLLLPPVAIPLT